MRQPGEPVSREMMKVWSGLPEVVLSAVQCSNGIDVGKKMLQKQQVGRGHHKLSLDTSPLYDVKPEVLLGATKWRGQWKERLAEQNSSGPKFFSIQVSISKSISSDFTAVWACSLSFIHNVLTSFNCIRAALTKVRSWWPEQQHSFMEQRVLHMQISGNDDGYSVFGVTSGGGTLEQESTETSYKLYTGDSRWKHTCDRLPNVSRGCYKLSEKLAIISVVGPHIFGR